MDAETLLTPKPSVGPWLFSSYFRKNPSTFLCYAPFDPSPGFHRRPLYNFHNCKFLVSAHGWMLLYNPNAKSVVLFNPVSGDQIPLPPLCGSNQKYPYRAALSAPPSHSDCIVMIVSMFNDVILCKLNNAASSSPSWTEIGLSREESISSVAYCEGKFYCLCGAYEPRLYVIYPFVSKPKARLVKMDDEQLQNEVGDRWSREIFLMESNGEVFTTVACDRDGIIEAHRVFRADFSNKKWVGVKTLGDRAVLLDSRSSVMVAAGDAGCKSNCIYYVNLGDYTRRNPGLYGPREVYGIFDMETNRNIVNERRFLDSAAQHDIRHFNMRGLHWMVPLIELAGNGRFESFGRVLDNTPPSSSSKEVEIPHTLKPLLFSSYFSKHPSSFLCYSPFDPSPKFNRLPLHNFHHCKFLVSTYGYMLLFNPNAKSVLLFNPVSGDQISLPPLCGSNQKYPYRAALSAPPNRPDCIVMIVSRFNEVILYRLNNAAPPEASWIEIALPRDSSITSVVCCESKFYFLCCVFEFRFYIIDPFLSKPKARLVKMDDAQLQHELSGKWRREVFLMESYGEVFLTVACGSDQGIIETFRLFRADILNKKWVVVEKLGDRVVFIDSHSGMVMSADDVGCKRNCIYYVQLGDYFRKKCDLYGPRDVYGVFDMETSSNIVNEQQLPGSATQPDIQHFNIRVLHWMVPSLNMLTDRAEHGSVKSFESVPLL